MKKLLICEGQDDQRFLYHFLAQYIEAKKIKEIIYVPPNKPDEKEQYTDRNSNKSYRFHEEPDEDFVILHCKGLDGIKKYVEKLKRLPDKKSVFHEVPKKIIWDEDPQNNQSQAIKANISELLKKEEKKMPNWEEPLVVEPMLEGLIISYLKDKNSQDENIRKSIECMEKYLECLGAKTEDVHAKIRLDLLEHGILIQRKNYGPANKNLYKEDKIIPQIFGKINFDDKIFADLKCGLQEFIRS